MSVPTIWDLYEGFGEQLDALLDDGLPLLLLGHVGSGSRELARVLASRTRVAAKLDPTIAETSEEFAAQLVADLMARVQPLSAVRLEEPTREAEQFRVSVARRYGDDAADAVAIYAGERAVGWTLARAIGRGGDRPLIVVPEVHRLADPSVLWELRDLAASKRIDLLLTSRPHHQSRLLDEQAPLFGSVRRLTLPELPLKAWMAAIGPVHPSDLEWLLERTRGRAAAMLEVLEIRDSQQSVRSAWRAAVRGRLPQAEDLLRVSRAVHSFAPRLLMAIAVGEAPYASIEGARPNRIAKALGLLHELDVVEQPRPRRWQIADPLLAEALRRNVASERGRIQIDEDL